MVDIIYLFLISNSKTINSEDFKAKITKKILSIIVLMKILYEGRNSGLVRSRHDQKVVDSNLVTILDRDEVKTILISHAVYQILIH